MSTEWHVPAAILARFGSDPAAIDDVTATSVEAHLTACTGCRRQMASTIDPAALSASWDAIADRVDRPQRAPLEWVLDRIGFRSDVVRLVAATPALQGIALLTACVVAGGAAVLSRTADTEGVFLALAPLIPLVMVAASFAPAADPAGEAGISTPVHGIGLVMRRALVVVGLSLIILGAASFALADLGSEAMAWVLPAIALASAALALGTWLRIEIAVGVLGGGWLLALWSAWWLTGPGSTLADTPIFSSIGQLTALVAAVAGLAVVATRRDRFSTMEVFQ